MPSAVWASASSIALIPGLRLYVLLATAVNKVINIDALLVEDNGQSLVSAVPLDTPCVAATERHDLTAESVGYKLVRVPSEMRPASSLQNGTQTTASQKGDAHLLLLYCCYDFVAWTPSCLNLLLLVAHMWGIGDSCNHRLAAWFASSVCSATLSKMRHARR